jgi:hypothetical protein
MLKLDVEKVAVVTRLDVLTIDRASGQGSLACPRRGDADGGGKASGIVAGLRGQAGRVHGRARQFGGVDGERKAARYIDIRHAESC